MEPELLGIVTKLIDGLAGRNRIDVVDDLAYPFPVAVICELLGVPHEDEPPLPRVGGEGHGVPRPEARPYRAGRRVPHRSGPYGGEDARG
jgi:cytochrome P450